MTDMVCHPKMLGIPKPTMIHHSLPRGHMRRPLRWKYTKSHIAPSIMVLLRKYSGVNSCSESFMMGQLRPHMSVSAINAQACCLVSMGVISQG